MNEKDHGKQSDIIATESTPKSKNKPSKQKRDAEKGHKPECNKRIRNKSMMEGKNLVTNLSWLKITMD